MNNFKKFVAVLLGVVMACVFATSAFAASTADKAAAIKSEMANYGLTGFDAVIDSRHAGAEGQPGYRLQER